MVTPGQITCASLCVMNVRQPLIKYVGIIKRKERRVFLVHYEKLAHFCKKCGLVGHEHKECRTTIHDEKEWKDRDWLYVDPLNWVRPDNSTTAVSSGKQDNGRGDAIVTKNKNAKKAMLEPVLCDTTSNLKKNANGIMEVHMNFGKCLNLDPGCWET